MRFLVDQPVSRQVARDRVSAGRDAVHMRDLGMSASPEDQVLRRASDDRRIVVTQDTDFVTLLVTSGRSAPSVVLFRLRSGNPSDQSTMLIANLGQIEEALVGGAIVVLSETTIRIRTLQNNE